MRRPRASGTLVYALALVALSAGMGLEAATQRAEEALGEPAPEDLRRALERSARVPAPLRPTLEGLLFQAREAEAGPWRPSTTAAVRVLAIAVALTLACLALVVPGSREVGLAGW